MFNVFRLFGIELKTFWWTNSAVVCSTPYWPAEGVLESLFLHPVVHCTAWLHVEAGQGHKDTQSLLLPSVEEWLSSNTLSACKENTHCVCFFLFIRVSAAWEKDFLWALQQPLRKTLFLHDYRRRLAGKVSVSLSSAKHQMSQWLCIRWDVRGKSCQNIRVN